MDKVKQYGITILIFFGITGFLAWLPEPQKVESNDIATVTIEDLVVGNGAEAAQTSTVKVNYIGKLEDGTEFDNSYTRGTPYEVNLTTGNVIQGWKDGIPGMKVGGKRKLTIPPELAYGSTGNLPAIPANATITFEVELLEIVE